MSKQLSPLGKAAAILNTMREAGHSLTQAEICTRTGLDASTVHRLVHELFALGWIDECMSGLIIGKSLALFWVAAIQHAYNHIECLLTTQANVELQRQFPLTLHIDRPADPIN